MTSDTLIETVRVLALALFDWSFAVACGWLLALYWLRGTHASKQRASPRVEICLPRLRSTAWLMTISLAIQFYVLTATFTGESKPSIVIQAAPSVATTHGGTVILAMAAAALILALASSMKDTPARTVVSAVCVTLIAAFHSALGHAAMDGNFSTAEIVQFLHLSAMALWAGGVIVSGLAIIPKLANSSAGAHRVYLQRLSTVSTYAVLMVSLSGIYKSWVGLDHHLSGITSTGWGRILLLKLVFVTLALTLGWTHRRWTRESQRAWTTTQTKNLVTTLRIEAACLTAVILISAWLSSVDPAGM